MLPFPTLPCFALHPTLSPGWDLGTCSECARVHVGLGYPLRLLFYLTLFELFSSENQNLKDSLKFKLNVKVLLKFH